MRCRAFPTKSCSSEVSSCWMRATTSLQRYHRISQKCQYFIQPEDPSPKTAFSKLQRKHLILLPPFSSDEDYVSLYRHWLKHLHLSHNCLPELISPSGTELRSLTSLQYLWVEHNHLTSIPESLADIRGLREIRAEHNQIPSIPPVLQNFMSTKEILPQVRAADEEQQTCLMSCSGHISKERIFLWRN